MSFLIQTTPAGLAPGDQKEAEIRSALFLSGRVTWMIWGPIDNSSTILGDSLLTPKIGLVLYREHGTFLKIEINVTDVKHWSLLGKCLQEVNNNMNKK